MTSISTAPLATIGSTTSGSDSLSGLPVELVEWIVDFLDDGDVLALRSASRFACKITQRRARTIFKSLRVDLETGNLDEATQMLQPGSLLSCVEHVTLTGVVYSTLSLERALRVGTLPLDPTYPTSLVYDDVGTLNYSEPQRRSFTEQDRVDTLALLETIRDKKAKSEQDRASGDHLKSLAKLFRQILRCGRRHLLQSLRLQVKVARWHGPRVDPNDGGTYKPIWALASHMLATTFNATRDSQLHVQSLDAFSRQYSCSVTSFDINTMLKAMSAQPGEPVVPWHAFKSFALSTSSRVNPGSMVNLWDSLDSSSIRNRARQAGLMRCGVPDRARVVHRVDLTSEERHDWVSDPANVIGTLKLLSRLSSLEKLDLHYCKVDGVPQAQTSTDSDFYVACSEDQ